MVFVPGMRAAMTAPVIDRPDVEDLPPATPTPPDVAGVGWTRQLLAQRVLDQITQFPETHNQSMWECGTTRCVAGWTRHFATGGEPWPTDYGLYREPEEEAADVLGLQGLARGWLFAGGLPRSWAVAGVRVIAEGRELTVEEIDRIRYPSGPY